MSSGDRYMLCTLLHLVPAVRDHLAAAVDMEHATRRGAIEQGAGALHVGREGKVVEAGRVNTGKPTVSLWTERDKAWKRWGLASQAQLALLVQYTWSTRQKVSSSPTKRNCSRFRTCGCAASKNASPSSTLQHALAAA